MFAGLSSTALAAKASGTLTAAQACEATTNKPEQPGAAGKNPDGALLKAGETYANLNVNQPEGAIWFYVRVGNANPATRWVHAACATAELKATPAPVEDGKPKADRYVFAVSCQEGFCATRTAKPECASATASSWSAGHFTLYGLWPNLKACGTNYGFCSNQPQAAAFCDYPEPAIFEPTMDKLKVVMPSAGACLQ